jgi:hypothetical protein
MSEQQKTPEVRELVRRKAAELVTKFAEYLKDKQVCEGRIGVEAAQEEYNAVLKLARFGPSVADRYTFGMRLLRAYYDEEQKVYKLKRYAKPVPFGSGGLQAESLVGSYHNADELMKAFAGEIANF